MTRASQLAFRSVGYGNIGFGVLGILFSTISLGTYIVLATSRARYGTLTHLAFGVMIVTNILFSAMLLRNGNRLRRIKIKARTMALVIYFSEVMYAILIVWLSSSLSIPKELVLDFARAIGIANVGLAPQSLIAYPVLAGLILTLCGRETEGKGKTEQTRAAE